MGDITKKGPFSAYWSKIIFDVIGHQRNGSRCYGKSHANSLDASEICEGMDRWANFIRGLDTKIEKSVLYL